MQIAKARHHQMASVVDDFVRRRGLRQLPDRADINDPTALDDKRLFLMSDVFDPAEKLAAKQYRPHKISPVSRIRSSRSRQKCAAKIGSRRLMYTQ